MVHRILNISKLRSFFVFGARGVGKSWWLNSLFNGQDNLLKVDLLKSDWEDELLKRPDHLIDIVSSLDRPPEWIIVDEIQKIPKLLDIVHFLIEERGIKFALTGSSARKLKRGSANLLAGRATSYEMFPLTHLEIGESFDIHKYLSWGGLPALVGITDPGSVRDYLRTYVSTYLREEIQAGQIVRNLKPFRLFLDVASQANAKILNYAKIAQDIGVDTKTVQNYFEILQDTHLGILLPAFHNSLRKRQRKNPKFYYFDTGVVRALSQRLNVALEASSFEYGNLFEQFLILEAWRMNSYKALDFRFSYLQTNNNLEVDLVIERPGLPLAFVEIKSSSSLTGEEGRSLRALKKDHPKAEFFCLSNDKNSRIIDGVSYLDWRKGLVELGLGQGSVRK